MTMSVDEVAADLQKSRWSVYRLIRHGKLLASKVGDTWRIRREDLDAFLIAARGD